MIEYEDALAEGYISEDALRFENPSFDISIVAVDYDGRLIYDYDLMVEELMRQDNMSGEEAIDFFSYNTLRRLDYMTDKKKPIVIMESIRNNEFRY